MASMKDVRETITKFLEKTLNTNSLKIIKIVKDDDGWDAQAEVYEESSFIKALGLSTKVQDKNIYDIKLDKALEVQSYQQCEGQ